MPLTRSALEAVLRKHLKLNDIGVGGIMGRQKPIDACVNDLLALAPTPSREALEKALARCETEVDGERYIILAKDGLLHQRLVDNLLAWATGQEPGWCIHCQWFTNESGGGRWLFDKSFDVKWEYPVPAWCLIPIPEDCTECPICATPRPSED